jgi:hypothetical protein
MLGSGGERKLAGCPTVCARSRQTVRGTSSVNSFLISRGLATLATGIFIQKKANDFEMELAFLTIEACIMVPEPLLSVNNCNQYLRAIGFLHISTKIKGIALI